MTNLEAGWIDSFRVDGKKFRMRGDLEGPPGLAFDEWQDGRWVKNLSFPPGDEFERTDLNGDGYKDLASYYQGWRQSSYYDPATRRFDTTIWQMPGDADERLDRKKNIYMNWRDVVHACDHPISELYTYRGGQPYFYYFLDFERPCNDDNLSAEVTAVKLYRNEDGRQNKYRLVRTVSGKNPKTFDYRRFWKDHYRELAQD